MSPVVAVRSALVRYASFGGRASRPEYWWFILFYWVAGAAAFVVDRALGTYSGGASLFRFIAAFGLLVPTFSVYVRRMHDIGRSGLWIFFGLVPFVGPVMLIVWLARPSQPGPNAYGEPPLAPTGDSMQSTGRS